MLSNLAQEVEHFVNLKKIQLLLLYHPNNLYLNLRETIQLQLM